jgi:hexokinase
VQRDECEDLSAIEKTLKTLLQLRSSTLEDRRVVKDVCTLVARRAARLAAVGIAAVVKQMEETNPTASVSAGIDGSVYEKHPCIKFWMEEALLELGVKCALSHSPDGSGLGAAIVAASAASQFHGGEAVEGLA